MMLAKQYPDRDAEIRAVEMLIEAGIPEGPRLEFKRQPYGAARSDKVEFLKDVSAMANAHGGQIIIGIGEGDDGEAASLHPLSEGVDKEIRRMQSLAQSSIDPPIIGLEFRDIQIEGGSLVVIDVPPSWNPPHRVDHEGSRRFWMRGSRGVFEPELEQLRDMFLRRSSVEERAAEFVEQRIRLLGEGRTDIPIPIHGGAIITHIVPLQANREVTVEVLAEQSRRLMLPGNMGAGRSRPVLSGYANYSQGDRASCYSLIFRTGQVECAASPITTEGEAGSHLRWMGVAICIDEDVEANVEILRKLGFEFPFLITCSLIGIKGSHFVGDHYWPEDLPRFRCDVDEIRTPRRVVFDESELPDISAEMAAYIHNAYGHKYFDK